MKRTKIQNAVGVSAILLLALLIGFVFLQGEKTEKKPEADKTSGKIIFESDELVFDGSGALDLMKGVTALDSDGKNATEKVDAIITGDGTLGRKIVRYTFVDLTGRLITEKRTLVMKNYNGPSLSVKDNLSLEAQDLKDLINVLAGRGLITAEDGYGRDITASVKVLREKKSEKLYVMKFSIINSYQDSREVTVNACIEGTVSDPEIRLSDDKITIRKTDYFDARKYIVYSSDGFAENVTEKIEIDSSVNTSQPGDYRVVYRLYSADKTAVTTKVLKVKVEI